MSVSRVRTLTTLLLVVGLLTPLRAAASDLDSVVQQRQEVATELDAATRAYEEARDRVESTRAELAGLEERRAQLTDEIASADASLQERARLAFMHGSDGLLTSIMGADGPQGAIERATLLAAVNGHDESRLEGATALRTQLAQTRTLLQEKAGVLADQEAQLASSTADLQTRLERLKRTEQRIRTRTARQRVIHRGPQDGVYSCVVDPGVTHFIDSWGFARPGGRAHKGVDVMAPHGVPVYAFTTGRVARLHTNRLGGTVLYVYGDDGNQYYYAHLSGYAEGVYDGMPVEAGQLVAYNGNSGDARGGASHVHFEVHPGGGSAVNPYPWMAAACD